MWFEGFHDRFLLKHESFPDSNSHKRIRFIIYVYVKKYLNSVQYFLSFWESPNCSFYWCLKFFFFQYERDVDDFLRRTTHGVTSRTRDRERDHDRDRDREHRDRERERDRDRDHDRDRHRHRDRRWLLLSFCVSLILKWCTGVLILLEHVRLHWASCFFKYCKTYLFHLLLHPNKI